MKIVNLNLHRAIALKCIRLAKYLHSKCICVDIC